MGLEHRKAPQRGIRPAEIPLDELNEMFMEVLAKGIHGISFSAYLEDQHPGSIISADQIRRRMQVIAPHIGWVRSFSCTDGNELIPAIAREFGVKTLVGAWLGHDKAKNDEEIEALIRVARDGNADMLAVGNEVLLRGDLTEAEIIDCITRVKQAAPEIPVGYVDAYFEFEQYPRIADACDVIMTNCYPFWEGYAFEHALVYLREMYYRAKRAARGKPVIVAETGWPNLGSPDRNAVPSYENAIAYFINAYVWGEEENVDIFYFASFDETWKIAAEGDVGAYWGLWDKDGKLKYGQNA
jgi:glucan 1,3-beta-glucosidase